MERERSGLGNGVLLETSRDFSTSMSACPCVGAACAGPGCITTFFHQQEHSLKVVFVGMFAFMNVQSEKSLHFLVVET